MKFVKYVLISGVWLSLCNCVSTPTPPLSSREPQSIHTNTNNLPIGLTAENFKTDKFNIAGLVPNHDIQVFAPIYRTGEKGADDWDADAQQASEYTKKHYRNARLVLATPHCKLFGYDIPKNTVIKAKSVVINEGKAIKGSRADEEYGYPIYYSYASVDMMTPDYHKLRLVCETKDRAENVNVLAIARLELGDTFSFPTPEEVKAQRKELFPPPMVTESNSSI